jgi:addiction module RelE/StbE family toxin
VKLAWTRRALHDLRRIADHIALDNPSAASRLVDAIHIKAMNLERFPLIGRIGGYQDTRELVVHKNYLLTYRVRGDQVQILQVWHVAQQRR